MSYEEGLTLFGQRWTEKVTALLGSHPPTIATWRGAKDISYAMNAISGKEVNHLFFPDGGGNDLTGARPSFEHRLVEFQAGTPNIVMPVKLTFHHIPRRLVDWSFFHLTTMVLAPTGLSGPPSKQRSFEPLTEYPDGSYDDYDCSQTGLRDGEDGPEDVPEGTRSVSRYIKPSKFVIFCKASLYNTRAVRAAIGDTYDGRHNTMSEDEFLQLIHGYALATS